MRRFGRDTGIYFPQSVELGITLAQQPVLCPFDAENLL